MPAHAYPSSSRMLASYITDIERLLDEQHDDAALREAFDLPRIAVALTDPQLRCSDEELRSWCREWIAKTGRSAAGLDYERVGRTVSERVTGSETQGAPSVPARALRRLRLRRHVRTRPRGFSAGRNEPLASHDHEALELCTVLVDAARRWYARCACHDSTVQTNLARLAVLR
ncbi:MAG TPA: hypothetical protein VEY89_02760 [Candidatus Dormibacteraeota bacterium]|nr:hypothetical protein [Candidatus Dormibacteraeota bacterium]